VPRQATGATPNEPPRSILYSLPKNTSEYSKVFFGPEYKVLRGGSFAVSPVACRGTFRNWDYPIRRQIFAGFRTARDAQMAVPGTGALR